MATQRVASSRGSLVGGRAAGCIAAALLATTSAACGASGHGNGSAAARPAGTDRVAGLITAPSASGTSQAACGPAAPTVLAQTVGLAAKQIYAREVSSMAVRADENQVERYRPLLSALASGDRAGVREAVTSLVYSHTHIVRLRVMQGTTLVADVGGPFILAPVGGGLRLHGRAVGRYLLSVQDDLGYVKLETRYIGEPLVLHKGGQRVPLEGTLAPGPANIPSLGPVSYRGVSYEALSFDVEAFPQGSLRISLLIPVSSSLAAASCAAIKVAALGHIARRTWHRFALVSAPPLAFVRSIGSLTGTPSYVRLRGRQLAGSTRPGPSHLPARGTIKYRGTTYGVFSFRARVPNGTARVYLLVR
jgi:hypothetical protein